MTQSYQNLISISITQNPNRTHTKDSKMVQYDTKMYLNYILNIIINIKLLIIPFLNLYRICMYSRWCDGRLNTDFNGLI